LLCPLALPVSLSVFLVVVIIIIPNPAGVVVR
jgi:hypothetical protein